MEAFDLGSTQATNYEEIAAQLGRHLSTARPVRAFWEGSPDEGFKLIHSVERRDQIDSRASWQFRTRLEHEGIWTAPKHQKRDANS